MSGALTATMGGLAAAAIGATVLPKIIGGGSKAAPAPVPNAPTAENSSAQLDAAAQAQAAGMARGRTSTMLTGGQGVTTDASNTSKTLLGQ